MSECRQVLAILVWNPFHYVSRHFRGFVFVICWKSEYDQHECCRKPELPGLSRACSPDWIFSSWMKVANPSFWLPSKSFTEAVHRVHLIDIWFRLQWGGLVLGKMIHLEFPENSVLSNFVHLFCIVFSLLCLILYQCAGGLGVVWGVAELDSVWLSPSSFIIFRPALRSFFLEGPTTSPTCFHHSRSRWRWEPTTVKNTWVSLLETVGSA